MAVENDIDVIAFMVRRLAPIHKHLYIIGGVGTAHHHHTVAGACNPMSHRVISRDFARSLVILGSRDLVVL